MLQLKVIPKNTVKSFDIFMPKFKSENKNFIIANLLDQTGL